MAKIKGYQEAHVVQLKDLRTGQKQPKKLVEQEREDRVRLLKDKKRRNISKAEQRKHDAKLLAESLVKFPQQGKPNPRVWTMDMAAPKDKAGKGEKKHPKVASAERKAKHLAERAEAKAKRIAERETKKAERLAKRAEKKVLREQHKAERKESKRLAELPTIEVTPAMLDNVMKVVNGQFGLNNKQSARLAKVLARFAKLPLQKLYKRMKRFEIRLALMQGLKLEIDAQATAAAQGAADNKQTVEAPKVIAEKIVRTKKLSKVIRIGGATTPK